MAWALGDDSFLWRNGQFFRVYGGEASDTGEVVTPKSALRIIVLLRCATLIAGSGASLPIDVFMRQGRVRIPLENHPVEIRLDSEPNPEMSSYDIRVHQWLSYLLWGNAYNLKVCADDRVIALWPLNPEWMEIQRGEESKELVYMYKVPGEKPYPYRTEEILHVRWYSLDGIHGMSAIEQARNGIGLLRSTEKSVGRFFRNGAQVSLQLEMPPTVKEEQIKKYRKDFEETYGGANRVHRVVVLPGGMKLSPIGVNPRDAQFLQEREYNDIQICMLMGVPPHMAGITSKVTSWGSGLAEQKQGFLDFTMVPHLTNFEKAYERCLLTKSEGRVYVKHNTNGFLRADMKARMDAHAVSVDKGIRCRDEVRALEDENPIPDGSGKIYTVQSQMIPLSDLLGGKPGPIGKEAPPAQEE